jgi:hypothetical protein
VENMIPALNFWLWAFNFVSFDIVLMWFVVSGLIAVI